MKKLSVFLCGVADDCKYKVNKLYAYNKLPCDCPDRCEYVDVRLLFCLIVID